MIPAKVSLGVRKVEQLRGKLRQKEKDGPYYYRLTTASNLRKEFALNQHESLILCNFSARTQFPRNGSVPSRGAVMETTRGRRASPFLHPGYNSVALRGLSQATLLRNATSVFNHAAMTSSYGEL